MKTLILTIFVCLAISVQAQTQTATAHIKSANSLEDMPVLHVTTMRDAGKITYKFNGTTYEQLQEPVKANTKLDIYFPAYIHGNSDPEYSYKMASTTPEITENTVFVDFIALMLYVDYNDARSLRQWRSKYFELYKEKAGI